MTNNYKTSRLGKKSMSTDKGYTRKITMGPTLKLSTGDMLEQLSISYKMSISSIVSKIIESASQNFPHLIDQINKINQQIEELDKANLEIKKLQNTKNLLLQESVEDITFKLPLPDAIQASCLFFLVISECHT